jgi:hypothetical protein
MILAATAVCAVRAADPEAVTLASGGQARVAVVAAPEVMAKDVAHPSPSVALDQELLRRRVRESVRDLALYLGRISGTTVEILPAPPTDGRVPILVGGLAAQRFGPPTANDQAQQGYRIVVTPQAIGLHGHTDLGTSYAVYSLLHQLGCRWYMPSDMGECIPRQPELRVAVQDVSRVPDTLFRAVWYGDDDFKRRNRTGGLYLSAGHALETTITKEHREAHPEWRAIVNGKPDAEKIKWTHPGVAEAISESILARHAKYPAPSYSLSPMDGIGWDESDDTKYDAGDWDDIAATVSKTDRLLVLCNRVAERVTKEHPGVLFGFLAYVDYTRPPVREAVHPALVPQIAPITFNRAHPMTAENHPNGKVLLEIVQGWATKVQHLSYYWYAYNLAEISAPNPFLTKWGTDVPILMANKCSFWMPETITNYESTMPGIYLGLRLSWDRTEQPAAVFDELFANFYGAAATPMAAYWRHIDHAWVSTPEYSGSGFGYLRIFTPEVLQEGRRLLDQGLAQCQTAMEFRRVQMADQSFRQLELFMKLRRDLAEGRLDKLAEEASLWRGSALHLARQYAPQYAFGGHRWAGTWHTAYFDVFFGKPYQESAELLKTHRLAQPQPLRQWRYAQDPNATDATEKAKPAHQRQVLGETAGYAKADFDDAAWATTDAGVETWSSIGLHNYQGDLWYRAKLKVPKLPDGKPLLLWIPSTDGSVTVYANGQHVPWLNDKGEPQPLFDGYCQPARFVLPALAPGSDLVLAIRARRAFLNELGTGGLLAPPYLFTTK